MRLARLPAVIAACAVLAAPPAFAPSQSCLPREGEAFENASARELYARGHLASAADRAREEEAFAFAAQATLALVILAPDIVDVDEAVDRVESDLERAFEAGAKDGFTRLQEVAVLGLMGRRMSPLRAHVTGVGSRARQRLNDILAENPDDPWALLFSGLWHLELVRRGGRRLAGLFYDADVSVGREQVERAVKARPKDTALLFEAGRVLFRFQDAGDNYADLARLGRVYLQRVVRAPSIDAVTNALSARADAIVNGAPYDPTGYLCPPYWLDEA